jgi:hypothetical protein
MREYVTNLRRRSEYDDEPEEDVGNFNSIKALTSPDPQTRLIRLDYGGYDAAFYRHHRELTAIGRKPRSVWDAFTQGRPIHRIFW